MSWLGHDTNHPAAQDALREQQLQEHREQKISELELKTALDFCFLIDPASPRPSEKVLRALARRPAVLVMSEQATEDYFLQSLAETTNLDIRQLPYDKRKAILEQARASGEFENVYLGYRQAIPLYQDSQVVAETLFESEVPTYDLPNYTYTSAYPIDTIRPKLSANPAGDLLLIEGVLPEYLSKLFPQIVFNTQGLSPGREVIAIVKKRGSTWVAEHVVSAGETEYKTDTYGDGWKDRKPTLGYELKTAATEVTDSGTGAVGLLSVERYTLNSLVYNKLNQKSEPKPAGWLSDGKLEQLLKLPKKETGNRLMKVVRRMWRGS